MKLRIIITFYLFSCSILFAANAELDLEKIPNITVVIQKKSYSCHLDSLSKTYICPNGNKPLLIKHSQSGNFTALMKDEENKATFLTVSSVSTSEKIIYDNSNFDQTASSNSPHDLSNYLAKQIFSLDEFLNVNQLSEEYGDQRKTGSPEYESIIKDYLDEKSKLETLKRTVFQESNYQVELSDGNKLNCIRGAKRSLDSQASDWKKSIFTDMQCGAFDCGNIIFGGKSYQASMLYESSPDFISLATIHLADQNGDGPRPDIIKVNSPSSKLPLIDNSNYLDNSENFTPIIYAGQDPIPPAIVGTAANKHFALYKDFNFNSSIEYNKNVCEKNNGPLKNIIKVRDKVLTDLSNMEMSQFITVLSNGALLGFYVDPKEAGKYGCMYGGLYLNDKAAENLNTIKKNIYPDKHVEKTISLNRAKDLFNKARAMKDIAWNYKQDGCYARAHLMARRFEAEGVRVDKVWIKGDLYVPEANIGWNFHVAPIVYVEDEKGMIKKMVIDPSLFDKPVTVEEWDHKITKTTKKGSTITAFPFPQNAAMLERSALAFSSSNPYLPGENIFMSEADKMEMANETMKTYKKIKTDEYGKQL